MTNKKNNKIALIVLVVLAFAGIIGFIIDKKLESPIGLVMFTNGGAVVFHHAEHTSEDGAAIECSTCHHNLEDGEEGVEMSCRKCHYEDKDIAEEVCTEDPTHKRCVGTQCATCHEDESCSYCHKN